VDDAQLTLVVGNSDDLQRNAVLVIPEEHQSTAPWGVVRHGLVESQSTVVDDEANLIIPDTMLSGRRSDFDAQSVLLKLSDSLPSLATDGPPSTFLTT
jgi:hypothetical protein